jgi:hypothetical protein
VAPLRARSRAARIASTSALAFRAHPCALKLAKTQLADEPHPIELEIERRHD